MDFKEIEKQRQDYCDCMNSLKNSIITWLKENIKEGEFVEFGDCSFHVLDEDDTRTKTSLCIGMGNNPELGVYCQVQDGYELWPEGMDPVDLYNVACCVNHILATKQQKNTRIMEKKKILQVFRTATDAYLEYVNNFMTKEFFTEFFNLDETEVDNLFKAYKKVSDKDGICSEIDHEFQILTNSDYSEKSIAW